MKTYLIGSVVHKANVGHLAGSLVYTGREDATCGREAFSKLMIFPSLNRTPIDVKGMGLLSH